MTGSGCTESCTTGVQLKRSHGPHIPSLLEWECERWANVWRKKTLRYEVNGKQATKATPGAKPRAELSKRWYGTLRLPDGRARQVPLSEDKAASA